MSGRDEDTRVSAKPRDRGAARAGIDGLIRDNGLSLVFFVLFIVCVVGQAVSGHRAFNETQASFRQPAVSLPDYLATGTFLDAFLVNWQAAILQLGALVVFSTFLYQRGAAHSKDPDRPKGEAPFDVLHRARSFVRDHSLSLVMLAAFATTFTLHLFAARVAENESRAYSGSPPVALLDYALSAKFWFLNLQTWEAEFMAMGLYIVCSIFFRQKDSPESKPPEAADAQTGGAEE